MAGVLKPENDRYLELPANEAISMTLAEQFSIEVPIHGLVFTKDNGLTYFIKRFDRVNNSLKSSRKADLRKYEGREYEGRECEGRESFRKETLRADKLALEDFAQLSGSNRETKYSSTVEKVIKIIDTFATFPRIEHTKLLWRILFNFVIGNEDMHLKNYSLINQNDKWQLAPAYDFLNTTIAIGNPIEESAFPINGRKHKLRRQDFIDYLAIECLGLTGKIISSIMEELEALKPIFIELIQRSYLTLTTQEAYVGVLNERYDRLYNKKSPL